MIAKSLAVFASFSLVARRSAAQSMDYANSYLSAEEIDLLTQQFAAAAQTLDDYQAVYTTSADGISDADALPMEKAKYRQLLNEYNNQVVNLAFKDASANFNGADYTLTEESPQIDAVEERFYGMKANIDETYDAVVDAQSRFEKDGELIAEFDPDFAAAGSEMFSQMEASIGDIQTTLTAIDNGEEVSAETSEDKGTNTDDKGDDKDSKGDDTDDSKTDDGKDGKGDE